MQRASRVVSSILGLCLGWSSGALGQAAGDAPQVLAPGTDGTVSALPAAAPPSAQATPGADSERETLMEEGLRLRQDARDEQALATFERAATLGRDGRVLAQIAFAEQAMGRWADSYLHLREAISDASDPWVKERLAMLQEELKKIEANVGRLEVRTNVAVTKLTIDGKPVDASHLAAPFIVPTGSVVVSAEAPGYLPTTRHVPVYAGSLSRAELVLVNEPTVTQRAQPARDEQVLRNPVWLYVAGAGALASIASVAPWLRGDRMVDGLERDCSMITQCPKRIGEDEKKVERLDAATNALLFGGLSVAALSTASYFLFPRREQRVTVTASAWLVPSSFGLAARVVH
jgi:hypothetical protein